MVYTFDSYIAMLAGVNAAVIFQNIGFWVAKNKANEKHFHDGKYWTYNSIRAFQSLFPFLSERQVQFAIQKLIECDLIEEGSFNELGFDRTKWYTLTNCGECLFTKDFSHLTNLSNGFDKNVKCICQKCQTNTICKHIYKNTDIYVGDESSDESHNESSTESSKGKSKRFTPPTVEEVSSYCKESGYSIDAQRFVDFYASKGWMVGKNKMSDWRAAVRNWFNRDRKDAPANPAPTPRTGSSWMDEVMESYRRREENQ